MVLWRWGATSGAARMVVMVEVLWCLWNSDDAGEVVHCEAILVLVCSIVRVSQIRTMSLALNHN